MPTEERKIAYLVSRFPKISETFILYEFLQLRSMGVDLKLFALLREKQSVQHPEAVRLLPEVEFCPLPSWRTWGLFFKTFARNPVISVGTLLELIYYNFGSLRYLKGALGGAPTALAFAEIMRKQGVSHVHAHFASHTAAMAFLIRRLTGIEYSFTAHGSDLHRDQHMLRQKVAAAKQVISVSDFNRELIKQHSNPADADKIKVIRCGIDTSKFDNASAKSARSEINIACVGTLHEVKGQIYLLQALRRIRNRSFRCRLIGDGPDREHLQAFVDNNGLAQQVIFEGAVASDAVAELLADTDIAIAPSVPTSDGRKEGIPVALMEAMASYCAVIASELAGIPELVRNGETGLLVAPRDVDGLVKAIDRLMDDQALRTSLSHNARALICSEYERQTTTRQLADVLFD